MHIESENMLLLLNDGMKLSNLRIFRETKLKLPI